MEKRWLGYPAQGGWEDTGGMDKAHGRESMIGTKSEMQERVCLVWAEECL